MNWRTCGRCCGGQCEGIYHWRQRRPPRVLEAANRSKLGASLNQPALFRNPTYRYIFGVGGVGKPCPGSHIPIGKLTNGLKFVQLSLFASLVKTDWETGKALEWYPPNGETAPCEPIYVPRPGSTEEDDGCVLTIVMDRDGEHSILVCLDAQTMTEVARAHMPQTFSLAPHGTFVEGPSMFPAEL